jgi:predicted HicB family RNase H-like nuclease
MPFNKDNAASLGSKGGKVTKPPGAVRDKTFIVKVTQAELDAINQKAKALKLSRNELIIRAVNEYSEE